MPQRHFLVIDLSNIGYISAGLLPAHQLEDASAPTLIYNSMLRYLRQLYRWLTPDEVIFACDTEPYWRQAVFESYKAQRRQTPLKIKVRQAISLLQAEKEPHCMAIEGCEADDIIYALTRFLPSNITMVSTDQDFLQLLDERIKLYHPRKNQFIKPSKQPEFDLFVKCMRGDKSDNIPAAYPRVLQRKLQQAFRDDKLMQQLMATEIDASETVAERYERNRQLIDLTKVPEMFQQKMQRAIAEKYL